MHRQHLRKPLRCHPQRTLKRAFYRWHDRRRMGVNDDASGSIAVDQHSRDGRIGFVLSKEPGGDEHVVQLFGVAGIGAHLVHYSFDRGRVEQPGLISVDVDGPARLHGMRSPFFERSIVHVRIRRCVQHFVGERGRLGRVARDEPKLTRMNGGQHLRQTLDVHRLFEAVTQRLVDQRVIGDLSVTRDVVETSCRVGKCSGQQVVRLHALQWRRHFRTAAAARDGQRDRRVPPPPGGEERRIEDRLNQRVAQGCRVHVPEHVGERERVLRSQREQQRVLGRHRLQLEIELTAETLAKCERPGLVDPAPERRVHNELHAARFVEEPLEHECLLRRNHAKRRAPGGEVFEQLQRGALREPDIGDEPLDNRIVALSLCFYVP